MSQPTTSAVPVPAALPDTEARTAALLEALDERILVLDGATGTALQGCDLDRRGLRRPGPRGLQREPGASPGRTSSAASTRATSRPAPTSSRPTPSARRRSCSPSTASPTRRSRSTGSRPQLAREAAPSSTARAAALRRRLDGPDDEGDHGHRRHHLRGAVGALPRPGAGPDRGRRRLPAARDQPGHAQRQGRPARHRAGVRGVRLARSRSRSRGPSSRWARCSPGRPPRRSRSRSRTPTCSTSASTAPPARSS